MAANTMSLPVAAVTVLEDRASVTRRGPVTLPVGTHTFRIEAVAACLVDKSLVGRLEFDTLPPGVRVLSVRVSRQRAVTDDEQERSIARLKAALRERTRELTLGVEARDGARAQLESLAALIALTLDEGCEDVALGRSFEDELGSTLEDLRAQQLEAGETETKLGADVARLRRRRKDVVAQLREEQGKARPLFAWLSVDVINPTDTEVEAELSVEYVTAGAAWRPSHRVSMETGEGGRVVTVQTQACVWQRSGEDWSEAALAFSTERPSLGARPPALATDAVSTRERATAVTVETREDEIESVGEGASPQVTASEVPGVDDGGSAVRLEAPEAQTILSDGRPYLVPLFSFTAPTEEVRVCVPELSEAVHIRSTQPHRGPHPLLAGPVELFRDGGFVGRTSVLYVAPGEVFELGWGPDAAMRVQRKLEFLDPVQKSLSSWTRKSRRIEVALSNMGATACAFKVRERVMVSEVEKVKVELDDLHRGTLGKDGIVEWDVHVPGLGRSVVQLQWTLLVHDDVQGV